MLVPLTAGENRLGAFGFSSVAPLDAESGRDAFLERVASEFAVAVEAFLAKQAANRERDRLRTLFEITNALVSKLERDELFSAISDQLSKVIRHDLRDVDACAMKAAPRCVRAHCAGPQLRSSQLRSVLDPAGMPAAEVLATGKPVVACDADIDRYPNPDCQAVRGTGIQIRLLGSVDRAGSC